MNEQVLTRAHRGSDTFRGFAVRGHSGVRNRRGGIAASGGLNSFLTVEKQDRLKGWLLGSEPLVFDKGTL